MKLGYVCNINYRKKAANYDKDNLKERIKELQGCLSNQKKKAISISYF